MIVKTLNTKLSRDSYYSKVLLAITLLTTLGGQAYGHSGMPNTLPWHVCESRKLGDSCSYSTDTARYTGSCREMNEELMCVRQLPIEYLSPETTHKHDSHVHE